jgi:chemotaxis protein CheX
MSVEIVTEDLVRIVESVFGTMMQLEVVPGRTPWSPSGQRLISAVELAGEWNGAVMLECDRPLACRFAGRFLAMEPPAAPDEVVHDVLGELANMVGGNLKCLFTGKVRLSMPSVRMGDVGRSGWEKPDYPGRLAFDSEEGPFWITALTTSCNV